jgi:hypothetical protein
MQRLQRYLSKLDHKLQLVLAKMPQQSDSPHECAEEKERDCPGKM